MVIYLIVLCLISKIAVVDFLENVLVHLNVHVRCVYTYAFGVLGKVYIYREIHAIITLEDTSLFGYFS